MTGAAVAWRNALVTLSAEDLCLLGRLAELLASADRVRADTARAMLDARPEPENADEARARLRAVVQHLEH